MPKGGSAGGWVSRFEAQLCIPRVPPWVVGTRHNERSWVLGLWHYAKNLYPPCGRRQGTRRPINEGLFYRRMNRGHFVGKLKRKIVIYAHQKVIMQNHFVTPQTIDNTRKNPSNH